MGRGHHIALTLAVALGVSAAAQAGTIVYDLQNASNTAVDLAVQSSSIAGVSAQNIVVGAGATQSFAAAAGFGAGDGGLQLGIAGDGSTLHPAGGFDAANVSAADAIADDEQIAFTIDNNSAAALEFTQLVLKYTLRYAGGDRSTNFGGRHGPADLQWQISIDGGAFADLAYHPLPTGWNNTVTSAFSVVVAPGSSATFRLAMWNVRYASNQPSQGVIHDIELTGDVTAIPTPAALSGAGALLMALAARRRG